MSFIVITGHAVMQEGNSEIIWASDMVEKKSLKGAISYGFRITGSDDFRIGHKRGEWLKRVSFMGEKFFDSDVVIRTAEYLGLKNYWDDPDDGCGVGWGN